MCKDVKPCADCPWTLFLLSGQPIFIMYCESCRHWYQSSHVTIGDKGYTARLYGLKKHVTSLLHCDALASKIRIQRTRKCGYCDENLRETTMFYSNPSTLAAVIKNLTLSSYQNSHFPAYTFLHRCGAHTPFIDAILKIRPELGEKVQKHLDKRIRDQQRFLKKILPLSAEADRKRELE